MDTDIEKILSDLQSGSMQAFEKIYRLYSVTLYNYIFKVSRGDHHVAEEIVQSTFVRLWEIREQVNPQESILYFLGKISKNQLINQYRHRTIEYIYSEYVQKNVSTCDHETEESLKLSFLNDYIDRLAEDLPPVRKEVFILSKRKFYSNKEIARKMNITESTVASHLHLALKYLREMLARNSDYIISVIMIYLLTG